MSIQYATGTPVNLTYTSDGSQSGLLSWINARLKDAGWTAISGDGTSDVLMETATTAQGNRIRVRMYNPGSGNCIQFTLKNTSGNLTSRIYYLLPTLDRVFRIVANKYEFFFFSSGTGTTPTNARGYIAAGTLWTPSSMNVGDGQNGWMQGNGTSDTDTTTTYEVWRIGINSGVGYYSPSSSIWCGALDNHGDADARRGLILGKIVGGIMDGTRCSRWRDGSAIYFEPYIGWRIGTETEPLYNGMLFGAAVLASPYDSEYTATFDGHNWINISHRCGSPYGYGSLFVAVS